MNHVNRVKGADLALATMQRLDAAARDVDFVVAGIGSMFTDLRGRYRSERIDWRGFLEEHERLALIASCDVMLLPFRTDVSVLGLSQTVLEVQAAGNVVVGSDTPAITPAVRHGVDGVLVRPGSVSVLADAALHLIGDSDQRAAIGRAAEARAARDWNISDRVAQLQSLLGIAGRQSTSIIEVD